MLGKRSAQRGLLEADRLYLEHVGRSSFYGFLASMRGRLFRDEDFAELYCADNGRNSVPPSLLGMALLLQTYDGVSDEEAKRRADFDIQWEVVLAAIEGVKVEAWAREHGFARYFGRVKTLFQMFIAATLANLTLIANRVGSAGISMLCHAYAVSKQPTLPPHSAIPVRCSLFPSPSTTLAMLRIRTLPSSGASRLGLWERSNA